MELKVVSVQFASIVQQSVAVRCWNSSETVRQLDVEERTRTRGYVTVTA